MSHLPQGIADHRQPLLILPIVGAVVLIVVSVLELFDQIAGKIDRNGIQELSLFRSHRLAVHRRAVLNQRIGKPFQTAGTMAVRDACVLVICLEDGRGI